MPDIKLFREDPEIIRKSQRRRSADVHLVDEVKKLDKRWRKLQFELDGLRTDRNRITKEIRNLKIAKADASEMISSTEENKELIMKKETEVLESLLALQSKLRVIGNLVHDSVPFGKKEDNSVVIRSWGQKRTEPKLMNHVELVERLGIADFKKGANVAGGRGYYLIGDGVKLKQALIDFGFDFLEKRGSTIMHTPLFMTKDIMAKCAQLAQFDEELYKVSGDGEDKYLINTAEQPLCAYHIDDWIHPSQLPLRYAGYSSCFCKDAGSHDRDTLGIFENVEQFCMTSPNGTDSWDMHEEMLKNSEDFYRLLNIPYQVVSIVSGALNDAAAKEYDLEGWFPASNAYRELVSCSNCTDYQSRRLEIRYGQIKGSDKSKEYVHMLNSTLTATERTMCCILENYQKEDGVEIPEALRRFMGGKAFIPFKMNSSQRDQTEEDHQRQYKLDGLRTDRNRITKEITNLKIAKADASEMISATEENKELIVKETEVPEALLAVQSELGVIRNLVHVSVPDGEKEDNNAVIRTWGEKEKRTEPNLKNHVELVELLGIADLKKGAKVAGGRGYYLIGDGAKLNQALINFGLDFLEKRGSTIMQTPFFMRKYIMAKCAQLAQFDEELYKVSGDGEDKYLIATSEQPLCAYHIDDWIHPSQLPLRYAGYSWCFRKEAGSHGRDTLGIFRVHEFQKVEQFCMTSPNGTDSWDMHEEMLKNSEDFYKHLNIPYQVVSISGALNDAAAKKYDLEGWFPASNAYRELVSCSNCIDNQSRRLEIRYGQNKGSDESKEYVHMLNCTLTATQRTMCCILENYQKEDGVEIPEALRGYMGGKSFIPFKINSVKETKGKKIKI